MLAVHPRCAATLLPDGLGDERYVRDRQPIALRPLDFSLPPDLEAHEPPEARGLRRDQVRLLVSCGDANRIANARFSDVANFLRPGDLVVANDSATLPAALTAAREDGCLVALHLSTRLEADLWVVEPRRTEVSEGDVLALTGGGSVLLLYPYRGSRRLWIARVRVDVDILDYLHRWGRPIAYPYLRRGWPLSYYQTVYAAEPGSVEMPSAGRAFTHRTLAALKRRGVGFATLTLHTGVASLEDHEPPYPEQFSVPWRTAQAVRETRARGGRVVGVGTTVVRALESAVDETGEVEARHGWTEVVITPERGVRAVDALLTGLHEPRSSHLAMLEAIAGREHLERAYQAALEGRYLWHEFGDLHLILPDRAHAGRATLSIVGRDGRPEAGMTPRAS